MAKTWQRLRGNANGRNGSLSWFCSGCGRKHSIRRDIEGTSGARKFCGASLRRLGLPGGYMPENLPLIAERHLCQRRNDLPQKPHACAPIIAD